MVPIFQCSPKYSRRVSACCSGVIMTRLRGHATDSPGRWKEPRAFAAADQTAQRARQGRGRRSIRRRVSGQCGGGPVAAGSLIPHACAIRALVIAMVEAAFGTRPMPSACGTDRLLTGGCAARCRAIAVAPITGRANREEAVAPPARFLPQRRVHVDAARRTDWTCRSNRGTRDVTGSVVSEQSRRSSRAWRWKLQALTASAAASAYARRARPLKNRDTRWTCRLFRLKGSRIASAKRSAHESTPLTCSRPGAASRRGRFRIPQFYMSGDTGPLHR